LADHTNNRPATNHNNRIENEKKTENNQFYQYSCGIFSTCHCHLPFSCFTCQQN